VQQAVLELNEVSFVRDGNHILDGIDMTVREGENWALIGANGAGKSTLLGICGAVSQPSSGTVHVLGRQLGRFPLEELRRSIGHVNPRHPLRQPLTVSEIVLTGVTGTIQRPPRWLPSAEDVQHAKRLIASFGLAERADARWPLLSQGERGRVLIARALISRPRLLLLDEPSTGLDIAAREQLLETVDRLERTHPQIALVFVTHHLEELPSTTTHALLLAQGRVVAQGEAETVLTTEHISDAFHHPIEVRHDDGRWSARARPGGFDLAS
jgi:iron complex transport system ATP-binding protein